MQRECESATRPQYREFVQKRRPRSLGLIVVGLGIAVGCERATAPSDVLEVLVVTEPMTLDPRFATRGLDIKLTRLVHAGLVTLDPDTLEPRPALAQSVRRRGEFELDVTLDPRARFHSGKPLEPGDVCATLEAVRDPLLQSPHRSVVDAFAQCRPNGPHSLQLTLNGPRASFMSDLEMPILRADQAHFPPKSDGMLDGLGPFRIETSTPSALRLLPASNGYRSPPRVPLVIRTVHDENARAMRIISGRAEIAPNAFSPALLSGFLDSDDIVVTSRPGANITYLLAQCDRTPFDRPEIRQGLSMAIDRQAIVMHLLASKARAAKWLIPEGHWAAPSDLPALAYDPNGAQRLLSHLGPVTLLTSTDRSRVLQARAVAQMLTDAGLATQVVPLELGLLLSRLDAGQFTLAILQIPELTEPNILSWFFHPRSIGGNGNLGKNRAHYRSEQAGQLLDKASATFDSAERRRLYFELARVMLSDMPVVPLWHEDQIVVARGRGKRFVPSAEGRWLSLADL
jgi:peptide/nickel transport system substrate-binding protein